MHFFALWQLFFLVERSPLCSKPVSIFMLVDFIIMDYDSNGHLAQLDLQSSPQRLRRLPVQDTTR